MNDLKSHIHDIEASLAEWFSRVDDLELETRTAFVAGEDGTEAGIRILEGMKRQHSELRTSLRALRIALEDHYDGRRQLAENHAAMFDEDFVMDRLWLAPD